MLEPSLAAAAGIRFRSREFKELEIVVFRHELAVVRRTTSRPSLVAADRVLLTAASRLLPRAMWTCFTIQAPHANAIAGRFVRTVRAECLDWLLIMDIRHLDRVLNVFIDHYNRHRAHRGLKLP